MAKPIKTRDFLKRMKAAGFERVGTTRGNGGKRQSRTTHARFKHPDGRTFSTAIGGRKEVDNATVRDLEILEAGGSVRRG